MGRMHGRGARMHGEAAGSPGGSGDQGPIRRLLHRTCNTAPISMPDSAPETADARSDGFSFFRFVPGAGFGSSAASSLPGSLGSCNGSWRRGAIARLWRCGPLSP